MKILGIWLRFRIFLVFGLFVFFFGIIFLRAFHIQVVEGGALEELATNQHKRVVNVESRRGGIFDRNLKELAVSIEVDSIFVQPARVEGKRRLASRLAPVLKMDRRKVERRLRSSKQFVWLKRQVDLPPGKSELLRDMSGVGIVKESRRFYPNRHLAANLIGFAGVDSKGLEGVEIYYDRFLKGASRKVVVEKDARGRNLLFEDIEGEARGMDVVLTIDGTIQYIVEKALKKALKEADAKGGTAVVMNPTTGEVLAMATVPTFDPNKFRRYRPWHWRNRVVTDGFEPGSTLKAFLLAALFEEGVLGRNDIFYCENGRYEVRDRTFHDHKKYGWLSLANIVKYSSNIGALKAAEKLGKTKFYRYLKAFGFGTRIGVDIPGEAKGSMRHYRHWSDVNLSTISFGQGISVTAIQLTAALSSIANGGFLMKPYVVKSIKARDGRAVLESNPVILRRVISESTAKKVTDILISVTESGGTGELAALDDEHFFVAGKTGTAQKPDLKEGGYAKGKYIASFMGFVPARSPRLSILITIDEPEGVKYGGVVAAPVFKEIATQTLSYMGAYPGSFGSGTLRSGSGLFTALPEIPEPEGLRSMTFRSETVGSETGASMTVPDFKSKTMRMVLRMADERSLEVDLRGSGRAVKQSPRPGAKARRDAPVSVWFQ
jgi:cell division protein FtsI (penicillin-binding protein 3)